MSICLRRREFIAALGDAAVAWPLAAHAQQGDRVRRIGVLMPTVTEALDRDTTALVATGPSAGGVNERFCR